MRPAAVAILIPVLLAAMALAALLRLWGAMALIAMLTAGFVWYRIQVRRTEASEAFFEGMGEETRMTGMQGGSPSELAAAETAGPTADAPPR